MTEHLPAISGKADYFGSWLQRFQSPVVVGAAPSHLQQRVYEVTAVRMVKTGS